MKSPFTPFPTPAAQQASAEIIDKVHAYMRVHPESELHRQGKMFGVLVYKGVQCTADGVQYLAAFSAKLDGSYDHDGFVPPVFPMKEEPIGTNKEESRRLQRLLFANYRLTNGRGETKNLLEIFDSEKTIFTPEEWFSDKLKIKNEELKMPPSGAGECCAPKLLQYAFTHGLEPEALAEFWVGAPSKTDVRAEGAFYTPCSGRCVPILRHMLQGIEMDDTPSKADDLPKPEVLYEDKWLIVANKPSGLLSVPGKNEEISVEELLGAKAVHRLDQDTSGLLVLAKTPEVYKTLQAYFQRRDVFKRYEAVVKPNLQCTISNLQSEGEIRLPILPNPYDRPRQMIDREHGKPAITRYVVRERRNDGTVFIDFYPLTGRTHQLRVHAAHPEGLNAPIVGDRLYNGDSLRGSSKRLMLHAAEITFTHPITQKEMHFCIPLEEK